MIATKMSDAVSMCKISAKSVQQFHRRCVPNRQTDRQTDRQIANLVSPITLGEIIINSLSRWLQTGSVWCTIRPTEYILSTFRCNECLRRRVHHLHPSEITHLHADTPQYKICIRHAALSSSSSPLSPSP